MAYTAAAFFLDPIGGSDSARTALTSCTASNPSGTITRINKVAHGLVTGAVVDTTLFSASLNGAFKITRVDADNFDLDDTPWPAPADASGTVTPRGGSSKADAWKTYNAGPTAARHQPGDTVRTIASPDPTSMGQSATWTKGSTTVTLASAVTADIDTGESAWTASANVTCSTNAGHTEGSLSASISIATAFTTGLAAYKAFSATNFSAYQQISFAISSNLGWTAGQLQLKLCSDAAGVTAVNTINIPAVASTTNTAFARFTVDTGGALGASIQSVALYSTADLSAHIVCIDNIIACKAPSAADSLSLTSMIGKANNLPWAASTTYAANAIRRPTLANRTGFTYKVTAGGGGSSGSSEPTWPIEVGATVADGALTWTCDTVEETWIPVGSIRGTTIKIDNSIRGYHGTTETVPIYIREPIVLGAVNANVSINGAFQRSGSLAGGPITYSGGWDRTNMTVQSGETWLAAAVDSGGSMYGFNNLSFITLTNMNSARAAWHFVLGNASAVGSENKLINCHAVNGTFGIYAGFGGGSTGWCQADLYNFVASNCSVGIYNNQVGVALTASGPVGLYSGSNSTGGALTFQPATSGPQVAHFRFGHVESKNNVGTQGVIAITAGSIPSSIASLVSADNTAAAVYSNTADLAIGFLTSSETIVSATITNSSAAVLINSLNGGGAMIITDGGTISQATDQRNTASGYSWKFNPTSTLRSTGYPLRLSLAKVSSAVPISMDLSVRRDNANIKGRLMVRGRQISGQPADAYVDAQPTINTWATSSLTFTPPNANVMEVVFEAYDGVGTTNSLWIDDLKINGVTYPLDKAWGAQPADSAAVSASAVAINVMTGLL